jgi:hypothetical protein
MTAAHSESAFGGGVLSVLFAALVFGQEPQPRTVAEIGRIIDAVWDTLVVEAPRPGRLQLLQRGRAIVATGLTQTFGVSLPTDPATRAAALALRTPVADLSESALSECLSGTDKQCAGVGDRAVLQIHSAAFTPDGRSVTLRVGLSWVSRPRRPDAPAMLTGLGMTCQLNLQQGGAWRVVVISDRVAG